MTARAASGLLLATDVADYLVGRGVPFRDAHEVVGALVRRLRRRSGRGFEDAHPRRMARALAAVRCRREGLHHRRCVGAAEADAAVDPPDAVAAALLQLREWLATQRVSVRAHHDHDLSWSTMPTRSTPMSTRSGRCHPAGARTRPTWRPSAAARGVRPDVIWHSGKLRARQTADAFRAACNPLAELSAIRGLQPTDPPEWIRDRLIGDDREIMLVGHFPSLPRILHSLVTGTSEGDAADFPLHGVVAVEWRDERWVGEVASWAGSDQAGQTRPDVEQSTRA